MAFVKMHSVGVLGLVKDKPTVEIPPEAWSDAKNVRFNDGKVIKMVGHRQVYNPPSIVPYGVFPVAAGSSYYWVYPGLTAIYSVSGSTHTDRSRTVGGAYTGAAGNIWTGGMFNGIHILNNGIDLPQFWDPISGSDYENLTNWPATYKCKVMRPFLNFLIAIDITVSGNRDAQLIKWSHLADPRTIPSSWDYTDPTLDAGERQLADTSGYLLDCLPLKRVNVIYGEDATYSMSHIGGEFIFNTLKEFSQVGMLAPRCACNLPQGDKHFVVTNQDIVTHNLSTAESILNGRLRRHLFNIIDKDYYSRSFVVPNYKKQEIWFCFPTTGNTLCNMALAWNYADDTLTFRDLPYIAHANFGRVVETIGETWDADTGTWNSDFTIWDERVFGGITRDVLMAGTQDTKLYNADDTNQFNGVNMDSYVERTALALIGQDRFGNPKVDVQQRKLYRSIWLRGEGGPVDVQLGVQETMEGAVQWETAQQFTFGVDTKLDFYRSGRAIAIKIGSNADVSWELSGYDIDIEPLGMY